MSLDPEYYSGVAPFGSPDYYALLFCPQRKREPLRVLFALEHVIAQLSRESADPAVRHTKLAWWASELDRLSAGCPRHPVAVATHANLAQHDLSAAPFNMLFAAITREASDEFPRSPTALLEHAGDRGAILSLAAGTLTDGSPVPEAEAEALHHLGRARFIAMELGAGHQHAEGQQPSQESDAMLRGLAAQQARELGPALEHISRRRRRQLAPLLVMAGLVSGRLGTLAETGRAGSASDFRILIRAWRNARRASRGKLPI